MQLNPKYLSFDEMLQKRLFEIPTFQRAYSWNTKQRKDLFSDIVKLYESPEYSEGRTHFMATVVCHDQNKEEEYDTDVYRVLNIVDGQQRVTTLIILLKAIHKKLVSLKSTSYRRPMLALEELLVKDESNKLILIQTDHSSAITLREYIVDGKHPSEEKIKTHAIRNLQKAFIDCEQFVEDWSLKHNLLDLLMLIKNKLFFILHVLDDEGSVYTVFEVLNSRGLAVDWLDKCKSMLMGIAFEKLKENKEQFKDTLYWLHQYWADIYEVIGVANISGDEIVRFTATLYNPNESSRIMKVEDALEYFKSICNSDPERVVEVSNWLVDVATELKKLKTNRKLEAVSKIIQARLAVVAINLSDYLSPEQREELLSIWEKVTYRVYGLFCKDVRHKVGDYVRLSCFLMGIKDLPKKNIYSNHRYKESIKKFGEIAADFPMKELLKEMENNDCYNQWKLELKYFFYCYERHLVEENGYHFPEKTWEAIWNSSTEETIEHIYPQTESEAWKGKVTKRKEFHCNRIGNLLILPRKTNSKLQNKGFNNKKKEYMNSEIFAAKELQNFGDWNHRTIEERTMTLLKWAQNYWSLPNEII